MQIFLLLKILQLPTVAHDEKSQIAEVKASLFLSYNSNKKVERGCQDQQLKVYYIKVYCRFLGSSFFVCSGGVVNGLEKKTPQ